MEPSIYSTFKKILIRKLRKIGAEVKIKREYIMFIFPNEDIIIKQKEEDITSFYFCKNGRINHIIRIQSIYGVTTMARFLKFYKERQLYLIEHDT